jgi:hypothetical protein
MKVSPSAMKKAFLLAFTDRNERRAATRGPRWKSDLDEGERHAITRAMKSAPLTKISYRKRRVYIPRDVFSLMFDSGIRERRPGLLTLAGRAVADTRGRRVGEVLRANVAAQVGGG